MHGDGLARRGACVPAEVVRETAHKLDVIPAKAGTPLSAGASGELGPCFRRDDIEWEAGIG